MLRFARPVHRCGRCAIGVPGPVELCGECLRRPPPFTAAVAAVDYGFPWSGLVAQYKFRQQLDLSDALAALMLKALGSAQMPDAHRPSPSGPAASRPDLLLPVPLSAQRLKERGFNQAWELARRLASALRLGSDARLLLRIRDTPHQLSVSRGDRESNVRGAFAIEPLRRDELRGKRIALVDDVMTTGATASELARLALQAGAAEVSVWVLARTPAAGTATLMSGS